MIRFDYHEPRSLDEAIALLNQHGAEAALLAGGTALLIDMKHGERRPGHVISLWRVPGLEGVQASHPLNSPNPLLRIGALTIISDLADAVTDHPAWNGLLEAAWMLGGRQVQNMATVGGNICKASPGADMVPPLLCLDAQLRLVGPDGERTTPLDGFLTGPDQTAIRPAEVLTEINVPPAPPRTGAAFLKVMRRHAVDCSIVAVAARVSLAGDSQTCVEARIALGAAAPNPFRARQAESLLTGQKIESTRVREAARQAREGSHPISDVRASADYRRMLVETLVERAVLKAAERAASPPASRSPDPDPERSEGDGEGEGAGSWRGGR
jgi:carbon-monoxide dehydrogenase medium subunit